MLTFEQAMVLTRTISSPTAYEDNECRALFDCAMSLEPGSTILEVGCEYGRSTSILAQVAREHRHQLILIDPFVDKASGPRLVEMLLAVGATFTLYCMETVEMDAKHPFSYPIHLLHIDGDHSAAAVARDCYDCLPWIASGGFACFHDYDRDSLPDVKTVVNHFMADGWTGIGVYGTLGIWKRR
jgi:predicted O-methyltransferase YrrM